MSIPHLGLSPATSTKNLTGNPSLPRTPDVSNTVVQTEEQGYAQSGRSTTGKCPFVCVLYKAAYHQSLGSDNQPDQPFNDEKIESIMKIVFTYLLQLLRSYLLSSDFAMGAVLSQQLKEHGKWHPVAFYSKSLYAVEWNYKIHDKEMLAIIWSFEEWWHFLEGAWHKFEV
ncbi:hypothetical protein E4T56_gene5667 [Termitomyces sp. T112]|nr:hypothetical protein E4T56_gene5667 [Termitomyces sp. T112]